MYKHFLHNRFHTHTYIPTRVSSISSFSRIYIHICPITMSLTKRTRFILVQSTNNTNVTEDNMEPYHISIFRRSTSMPPLPRLSSNDQRTRRNEQTTVARTTEEAIPIPSPTKVHRREKMDRFNIHAMKRKSVRFSRRLSSVLGFTAQTIDEQFNFQEQRFRALEKFFKIFLRNTYTSVETLRVHSID